MHIKIAGVIISTRETVPLGTEKPPYGGFFICVALPLFPRPKKRPLTRPLLALERKNQLFRRITRLRAAGANAGDRHCVFVEFSSFAARHLAWPFALLVHTHSPKIFANDSAKNNSDTL